MIELKKEELLKNTMDYEEYSENVCSPTLDELRDAGMLKCGGSSGGCGCKSKGNCSGCKSKKCEK
ncbi:hypothetical protein [Clostridium butyricum]|uniref:hypothetical protein n=1 Tax=Clostridium butyricum TaxID=1492 RepID=UPI00374E434C